MFEHVREDCWRAQLLNSSCMLAFKMLSSYGGASCLRRGKAWHAEMGMGGTAPCGEAPLMWGFERSVP